MSKHRGKVTRWQDDKGFGFIETDQGESLFFHISEFKAAKRPVNDERVSFTLGQDKQGRSKARQVQPLAFDQPNSAPKRGDSYKHKKITARQRQKDRQKKFKVGQIVRIMVVLSFYALLAILVYIGRLNIYVIGWYVVISVITFLVYAKDKSAAQKGQWRTPESNLHLMSLIGGWSGGLLAQMYLRHKSVKTSFRVVYYLTAIINLLGLVFLINRQSNGFDTINTIIDLLKELLL